ncbi:putative N-sulfoglucosamine sulfohydrolase [Sesbania bispinosa]|nr:putative N-sulfoglucosamine sulfohydrolase [Sesbania bispinosa]
MVDEDETQSVGELHLSPGTHCPLSFSPCDENDTLLRVDFVATYGRNRTSLLMLQSSFSYSGVCHFESEEEQSISSYFSSIL